MLEEHNLGIITLSETIVNSLKNIEVLVYSGSDRNILWLLQGMRHINGIKEWGPLQQSRFLFEMQKTQSLRPTELDKMTALGRTSIANKIRSYKAYQYCKEVYHGEIDESNFSLFQEVIFARPIIKEWLGWDDNTGKFTNDTNLEHILDWYLGDEEGDKRINRALELRDFLNQVLQPDNKNFLQKFINTPEYSVKEALQDISTKDAVKSAQRNQLDLEERLNQFDEVLTSLNTLPVKKIKESASLLERYIQKLDDISETSTFQSTLLKPFLNEVEKNELRSFFNHLVGLNQQKLSISESFITWLMSQKNGTELEALEIFEIEKERIIDLIQSDLDFHRNKFTYSKYQFATYDTDILVQTHLLQESKSRTVIASKINWWQELHELIRKIDWRSFELLARQILKENGLSNITITQAKNDQGIDFYGYCGFEQKKHVTRLERDITLRIVGQVKHSEDINGVNHQKIASFGTEIVKLRKLNNSQYFDSLDERFLSVPYPIAGIFITNSYYPRKAIDFANEYGIIFWDGVQISQDLATPFFISKITDDSGKLSKDKLIAAIDNNWILA